MSAGQDGQSRAKKHLDHRNAKNTGPQNWLTIASAGRSGFAYNAVFTKDAQLKVELYIDAGDRAANKAAFDALLADKLEIEGAVGSALSWERLENARASRIAACRAASVTDTPSARDQHIDWAAGMLGAFRNAFSPRLNTLQLAEPPGDSLT